MRIAINTLALHRTKAGMGKYIVELVNRVVQQDAKNTYLFYVSEQNQQFFDLDKKESIIVKKIPKLFAHPYLKVFWEQCFLPFSLWKNNIDLYHSVGFTLPFFKRKKTKYVVTIADLTFFTHPTYHTKIKQLYFPYMIKHAAKTADLIIAISENTKKDIEQILSLNPKKIVSIHLGVDAFFTPVPASDDRIFQKYHIQSPYILFVGVLEPRKNIDGLIKAFAAMRNTIQAMKNFKNYTLVIVGKKGWLFQSIFDLVKAYNLQHEIIFTGYVPDEYLPAFYRGATCFVYPSFYEGFGIPILEAMASGCPVITSNLSSMKEIVGESAMVINPKSTESIQKAMEALISNKKLRESKIKAGLFQVKKFSWGKMVQETILAYDTLDKKTK